MKDGYERIICESCKSEFERYHAHPYIKLCKKCRKHGASIVENEDQVETKINVKSGKDFQFLPEFGIKINACCLDKIKKLGLTKTGNWGMKSVCQCGLSFRILSKTQVGIAQARYRIEEDKLVLESDYRKHVDKNENKELQINY